MTRAALSILFLLLIIAGIHLANTSKSDTSEVSEVDQILFNAVLRDLEGEELTLKDFEGKTILIDIWETWCTPCLISMPTLQKLMDDYPDDFVVLAVSPGYMDTPEQVQKFVDNNNYDFVFAFGEDLARDLGVHSLPYKVYVNPNGQHIKSVLGSQGPDADYENTREIIENHL
ncbi:MAG: TlpA disulfide reductase family protein [Balneolales bacterium]